MEGIPLPSNLEPAGADFATMPSKRLGVEDPNASMARNVGKMLGRPFRRGGFANKLGDLAGAGLDQGPIAGALTLGLPAFLLAHGAGKVRDAIYGTDSNWGIPAALAAGGLGAFSGYMRTKGASADGAASVIMAITRDNSIGLAEKKKLVEIVAHLDDKNVGELSRMLATAGGAGAGALIAHFILGLGTVGTLAGAYVGGNMGRSLMTDDRHPFGTNRDAAGNSYHF